MPAVPEAKKTTAGSKPGSKSNVMRALLLLLALGLLIAGWYYSMAVNTSSPSSRAAEPCNDKGNPSRESGY